jgi:hypothetical protein
LDAGRTGKSDPHDARSAVIVALRHPGLRTVTAVDHGAVLRLLADRHHDLVAQRTRVVCRLHALLCLLIPGGMARQLTADTAARTLRSVRPVEPVDIERKRWPSSCCPTSDGSTPNSQRSRTASPPPSKHQVQPSPTFTG